MIRSILMKTLPAATAALLAYGLSFSAAIAADTGPANAQTEIGTGYHVPQTHDPALPALTRAPLHAGHVFVTKPFGSEGEVNAQSDAGDGYHVPQTHAGMAAPVSRTPVRRAVSQPDNTFSFNFGGN